ncbi:MAG: signal peptidase I, partial [Planctomycetota bacterium]
MTGPSDERSAAQPPGDTPGGAAPRRIWRDNFEAFTMALVVAVMLKYFVVEAYKIPSGSMQPTLMGWNDGRGGGLFDRVLVDKLSYHQRDPERFEVVVFQFPLDRSKHFIKRLVGMPGDHLRIQQGDLWLELPDAQGQLSWQILRRPAGVQETHWFEIEHEGRWNLGVNHSQWQVRGTSLEITGVGRTSFPGDVEGVKDLAVHGYPSEILEHMGRPTRAGGQNDVGDLRLGTSIRA